MIFALDRADPPCAPAGACPPIGDEEIVAASQSMNLAGTGGGSGARLLSLLLDDTIDLPELARRISAQPAIAVRVMRVANSAYYRHSGEVATVDRAAQLLGSSTLRGIAAAACFDRMSAPNARGASLDLPAFRGHSLAAACAAQALARRVAPALADEAFIAGLLHDLGIIVQWRLRPQWLARLDAIDGDRAFAHHAGERQALGATHTRCGSVLLAAWNLPASLVAAVAAHGFDDEDDTAAVAEPPLLATLLTLADHLAAVAGFGFRNELAAAAPDPLALDRCGLTPEHLAAMAATVPASVDRLCAAFGSGTDPR